MRPFGRRTVLILGLLLAFLAHAASFGQSVTTSGSDAALCQFAYYHFQEDAEPFFRVVEDHHCNLTYDDKLIIEARYAVNPPPSDEPTLFDFLQLLERGPDLLLVSSHGKESPEGVLVEGYASASVRDQRMEWLDDMFLVPTEIVSRNITEGVDTPVYGILARADLCQRWYNGTDRAIVFAAYCFGGQWLGAWDDGAAVGYTGSEYTWHAAIDTFFTRMNGERGRLKRTTGEGVMGTGFIIEGSSHKDDIVFSPAVAATHPEPGYAFESLSYHDAWIDFDTEIEIVGSIDEVLGIATFEDGQGQMCPCAFIQSVELTSGDTRLEFEIRPNVRDDFPIWVNWDSVCGKGSTDRYLNGNTDPPGDGPYSTGTNCRPPDQDDYVIPYSSDVGQEPAASVLGLLAVATGDGVHLRWETLSEKGTDCFVVCRSADGAEWEPASESIPRQAGPYHGAEYEWTDTAGAAGDLYRLQEIETGGSALWHQIALARSRGDARVPAARSREGLASASASRGRSAGPRSEDRGGGAGAGLLLPGGSWRTGSSGALLKTRSIDALIFCPDEWTADVQPLVDHWHESRDVSHAVIVPLSEVAADPCDQDIKDYVDFITIDNQLDYILLVGDASRSRPERDILPTHYVHFEGCYFDSVYSWDGWYGDLDDDGIEEVAVGRLLARDAADVTVQVGKSLTYDTTVEEGWRSMALGLVEDESLGGCDGPWARDLANSVMGLMPSSLRICALYDSEIPVGYSNREEAALAMWNKGIHLVYASGTRANCISLVEFFNKYYGFSVDMLTENHCCPIVLGACCGLGDHVLDPQGYDDDLVTDFQTAYGKGSLAWLAFTENTQQWFDYAVASEFATRIDMDGTMTLGEIWLAVKESVCNDYPQALPYLQMWAFFGDPTISMAWSHPYTGVSDSGGPSELLQSFPNPFNPATTISYVLDAATVVTLRVYDVAGRRVRTLVDAVTEQGLHSVVWDGTDEEGRALSSGVYFCRLDTADCTSTKKMLLLK